MCVCVCACTLIHMLTQSSHCDPRHRDLNPCLCLLTLELGKVLGMDFPVQSTTVSERAGVHDLEGLTIGQAHLNRDTPGRGLG